MNLIMNLTRQRLQQNYNTYFALGNGILKIRNAIFGPHIWAKVINLENNYIFEPKEVFSISKGTIFEPHFCREVWEGRILLNHRTEPLFQ